MTGRGSLLTICLIATISNIANSHNLTENVTLDENPSEIQQTSPETIIDAKTIDISTTETSSTQTENSSSAESTTDTIVNTTTDESTTEYTTTEDTFVFKDVFGILDEKTTTEKIDFSNSNETNSNTIRSSNSTVKMQKLSDQIRAVIKHYSIHKTVVVPNSSASFPDPMTVPDMDKNFGGVKVKFSNNKVFGLSNFTIEHINTDLDKMQVFVSIYMKRLVVIGNYTATIFFTRKITGPFEVNLLDVEASAAAALVRDSEGNLQASESEMDMTFFDSKVRFGNMGLMGTMLEGVLSHAGPVLFESIKPIIISELNTKIRSDINIQLKTIGTKIAQSKSTPPLELALQEGRKYVRENGYDPYHIKNYELKQKTSKESIISLNISQLILTGLSNFRRVGEVSLSMDSGTVQMGIHLATAKLKGTCKWTVKIGPNFKREGLTNFTVEYLQAKGFVNQSLDVKQHPVLQDLDVNVGKVRVQVRGINPFDFVIESLVNTLPDLLRHIIVDAIEIPLKLAVQYMLNQVDVEEVLEKTLPKLDSMGL